MQDVCSRGEAVPCTHWVDTTHKLLDGLVIYRSELGETGKQLEYLLRLGGVQTVLDTPRTNRVH